MDMKIDSAMVLLTFLRKKHLVSGTINDLKTKTVTGSVLLKKTADLFIRDALTGKSTILQEDLENHFYIVSIKIGFLNNALAHSIITRNDNIAEVVVYAQEGLIKQQLAQKAFEKIKAILS